MKRILRAFGITVGDETDHRKSTLPPAKSSYPEPEPDLDIRLANLADIGEQNGFELHNVPDNGDCFFHAIYDQIKQQKRELRGVHITPEKLRQIAIAYLRETHEFDEMIVALHHCSVDKFIQVNRKTSTWADDIMITALHKALAINLVIFTENGDKIIKDGYPKRPTLHLGYINGLHYVSFRKMIENRHTIDYGMHKKSH